MQAPRATGSLSYVIILIIACALAYPALHAALFDDAYIHARIARNFLSTGSPFFNAGEAIKTSSSTGYVMLLAALSFVTRADIIDCLRALQFVTIIASVIALFALCLRAPRHQPITTTAGALAIVPCLLWAAWGGMETSLACLLMMFTAHAMLSGRHGTAVLCAALTACLRFEGMVLLGALLIYRFRQGDKKSLGFASPALAMGLYEWQQFGTILPHAAIAKPIGYNFSWHDSLLQVLSLGNHPPTPTIFSLLLLALLCAQMLKILHNRLRFDETEVFILFATAVVTAWGISRSMIFFWYYALLACPLGLWAILSPPQKRLAALHKLVTVIVLLSLFFHGIAGLRYDFLGTAAEEQANQRTLRYLEIGKSLHSYCPECTLLTSEIGALGYSFQGKIQDGFGLSDPSALAFHPLRVPEERRCHKIGAIPWRYVALKQPDFLVSMPMFSQNVRESGVLTGYHTYHCALGRTVWYDDEIQVFTRSSLPKSLLQQMRCITMQETSETS